MFVIVLIGMIGAFVAGFGMARMIPGPTAGGSGARLLGDRIERLVDALALIREDAQRGDALAVYARSDAALRTDEALRMRDAPSLPGEDVT